MPEEMRAALDQRRDLIESRARVLAVDAVNARAPWLRRLGPPPADARHRDAWLRQATVVAAYRDRYRITARTALGPGALSDAQRLDEANAKAAIRRAAEIANLAADDTARGVRVDAPVLLG